MAKKLPTGERPKQLSKTAKTIKKAAASPSRASGLKAEKITPREAARRAGVERDRMNRKTNTAVFNSKTSTVYSPKPMSAAAKAKAAAAGKATGAKTKPKSKSLASKVGGVAGSVAKRIKTTAREARDVYTAVGSAAQALRKSPQEGIPVKKTIKNIGTQVKETARAAATGKKGTTAYKVKPDPYSKKERKAAGGKGFVFYDVTKPKKR
jgi:hypothetical protein